MNKTLLEIGMNMLSVNSMMTIVLFQLQMSLAIRSGKLIIGNKAGILVIVDL